MLAENRSSFAFPEQDLLTCSRPSFVNSYNCTVISVRPFCKYWASSSSFQFVLVISLFYFKAYAWSLDLLFRQVISFNIFFLFFRFVFLQNSVKISLPGSGCNGLIAFVQLFKTVAFKSSLTLLSISWGVSWRELRIWELQLPGTLWKMDFKLFWRMCVMKDFQLRTSKNFKLRKLGTRAKPSDS